jgi:cytochrome c biogenesis protein CcmG/thiol:disulfide interchange protein DsbE
MLFGSLACGPGAMPASIGHPLAGEEAPAFRGVSTEARAVGIPARSRTTVTVIDFWASWCDACQVAIPALDAIYQRHKEDGVMVIGVSVDDTAEEAIAAMDRLHATFPIVVDPGQRIAGSYGVAQIPTTFVVDRAGTVRWVGRRVGEAQRAVEVVLAER